MLDKVLVVDDSDLIHNMYKLMLKKYRGCAVLKALNGQEALDKLADESVDLILLDINMPVMNGIQFLETIQKNNIEVIKCYEMSHAELAIGFTFFNIVIADIRLTGVLGREGLELLPYINEKSPGTKTIIMTGYDSEEIRQEAYERGAFHYFEKPIDLEELSAKLEEAGISGPDTDKI